MKPALYILLDAKGVDAKPLPGKFYTMKAALTQACRLAVQLEKTIYIYSADQQTRYHTVCTGNTPDDFNDVKGNEC